MGHLSRKRHNQLGTGCERLEARYVFTAQSPVDFQLDYFVDDMGSQDPLAALVGADDLTRWSAVRNQYGFSGLGQTVAVIDSGIAYDHYALGGGFGSSYRVVGGWDFTEENDANPYDDAPGGAHGTHVAGIIGSSDATHQGVAPGVDLVALRVFNDQGQGRFDWVEQALRWVHANRNAFRNPITTVNLSIGSSWNANTPPPWATLEDEFAQLAADGIFVAVAAGNSFTTYNSAGLSYPAVSQWVVPVASVDASGQLSSYSQRNDRVIAAPGRGITSTVPDYLGNYNGRVEDFATFSGTSMAAPYVAGASTIIREALQTAGYGRIDQETIYNWMRGTADAVWDNATGQAYLRLNLERALNMIMPADDWGSTVAAAWHVGTIDRYGAIGGTIDRTNDRDYFSFIAGQSGTVTLTTQAQNLSSTWDVVGSSARSVGADVQFDVVAGRSYTIGIGASGGMGKYVFQLQIHPSIPSAPAESWGSDATFALTDQSIGGGRNAFAWTAARSGTMTLEATYLAVGGNVDFQIYDAQNRLISTTQGASGQKRLDAEVVAGQSYTFRAVGANAHVDVRLANLMSRSGNSVSFFGSAGDDQFHLLVGTYTHQATINGIVYYLNAASSTSILFDGQGGSDVARLVGTESADSVLFGSGGVELSTPGTYVVARNAETVEVFGQGGSDQVTFTDTAGNDTFVSRTTWQSMAGNGYQWRSYGFEAVRAVSGVGQDVAQLYDSAGNDSFVSRPTFAVLSGGGVSVRVERFSDVNVIANTGYDQALLYGLDGQDVATSGANYLRLSGTGFSYAVQDFEYAWANTTTNNWVTLTAPGTSGLGVASLGMSQGQTSPAPRAEKTPSLWFAPTAALATLDAVFSAPGASVLACVTSSEMVDRAMPLAEIHDVALDHSLTPALGTDSSLLETMDVATSQLRDELTGDDQLRAADEVLTDEMNWS
jgi:subtilisin family serine protease